MTDKPKIEWVKQGTIIVESDGIGGFLVMFPDGHVRGFSKRGSVESAAKTWFKKNLDAAPGALKAGIGRVEWRE